MSKGIFKLCNYVDQNANSQNKFETTSITEGTCPNEIKNGKKRRTSETFKSQMLQAEHAEYFLNSGKVNIFEKTYQSKNHEYVAGQR